MDQGTFEAQDEAGAAASPLASRLLAMPEVSGVYLGHDFISVTKREGEWPHLKPAILGAIMEHFVSGAPVVTSEAKIAADADDEFFDPADAETVENIKELIETRVRPAVASDGGDITFRGYRDGVVYLNMRGACSGCPSSTATLKHGIQNLLRHFLPEVREVEAIQA
jgi:Fe-S cluster biogenesis protein NfuA